MCRYLYDACKWQHACELANIVDPQEFERRLRRKGGLDPPVPVPRPKKAGDTPSDWDSAPCRGYSVRGKRRKVPLFCAAYENPAVRALRKIKNHPVVLARYGGGDDVARAKPTPSTSVDAPRSPVSESTLLKNIKTSFYFGDNVDPNAEDEPLPDEFLIIWESDLSSCGGDFTHFLNFQLAERPSPNVALIISSMVLRLDYIGGIPVIRAVDQQLYAELLRVANMEKLSKTWILPNANLPISGANFYPEDREILLLPYT